MAAAPDYLAPIPQPQLKQQATKTINSAYAPALKDIANQRQQAVGLANKRSADNKAYQAWLDAQMGALKAQAEASHAQVTGLVGQLASSQQAAYAHQQALLTAAANARPGNVSNNAQSTAFGSDLAANQAGTTTQMAGAGTQAAQGVDLARSSLGATAANNAAYVQEGEQKNQSNLQTTLTNLGNLRAKTLASRTADTQKEFSRLQGIEIQKAQSNRDAQIAATKLNVTAQNNATKNAIAQQNANTNSQRVAGAAASAAFNNDPNAVGSAAWARVYGKGGGAGTGKPLSLQAQTTILNRISRVQQALKRDIQKYHGGVINSQTLNFAWHDLNSGRATGVGYSNYGPVILNAAYQSLGPGLNSGDVAALRGIGLTNLSGLKVQPNRTPSQTVGHVVSGIAGSP